MLRLLTWPMAASVLVVSPATAAVYVTGGAMGLYSSVSVAPFGAPLMTATGHRYIGSPGALTNMSQLTRTSNISRTAAGIGVCSEGGVPDGSGNQCEQIDATGTPNEVLVASFGAPLRLTGLRLSAIDSNDTLSLYGVGADGSLNLIGFGGAIAGGLDTFASTTFVGNQNGNTWDVEFAVQTAEYSQFAFSVRNNTNDGYRIDQIMTALPEPGTWALMIGGFFMVGVGARRRRPGCVAA